VNFWKIHAIFWIVMGVLYLLGGFRFDNYVYWAVGADDVLRSLFGNLNSGRKNPKED